MLSSRLLSFSRPSARDITMPSRMPAENNHVWLPMLVQPDTHVHERHFDSPRFQLRTCPCAFLQSSSSSGDLFPILALSSFLVSRHDQNLMTQIFALWISAKFFLIHVDFIRPRLYWHLPWPLMHPAG